MIKNEEKSKFSKLEERLFNEASELVKKKGKAPSGISTYTASSRGSSVRLDGLSIESGTFIGLSSSYYQCWDVTIMGPDDKTHYLKLMHEINEKPMLNKYTVRVDGDIKSIASYIHKIYMKYISGQE